MIHAYWLLLTLIAGFGCGWAFFKHIAGIKAAAQRDANQLRQSVANIINPK